MSEYQERQRFLDESLKENTLKKGKPFTRKKIKLDVAMSFDDDKTGNTFKLPYRGFWIVDSATSDFKVNMKINTANSYGDSLPLRPNMNFDFGELVDGAKFEFEAQAGGWIEILFFHKGYGQLGNVELESSGAVSLSDGSSYSNDKETILAASAVLALTANNDRGKTTVVNESGVDVYFGTEAKLNAADFKDTCMRLASGGGRLAWANKSGLYFRADGADTDIKYFEEVA